jgi:hypothetical protein
VTTDLTFFTNEPDAALLDRFRATLRDVQFFDVRGEGPQAAQWERELNALVYELYGLTEDEIAIVEERA